MGEFEGQKIRSVFTKAFSAWALACAIAIGSPAVSFSAASDQPASGAPSSAQAPAAPTAIAQTKEWYEHGPWPLVGAIAALVITNAVSVGVVYLQSGRAFNAVLRQRKIEFLTASLSEFYNPLLALLEINGEIFAKTGPPSFPNTKIEADAATLIWNETKKIILSNNEKISKILSEKNHLLHSTDRLDEYKKLLIHVAMYDTFQRIETDRYMDFRFPREIQAHVKLKRSAVTGDYDKLAGSQI